MKPLEDACGDYGTALVQDLATIDAGEWDALVRATCGRLHPGLRHAFLDGLHRTGCASPDSGWHPVILTIRRGAQLVAAVPLYAKDHSYGEYVFDWAWAEAYAKNGLDYYPKLLAAIPFSPIGAPKLLALDAAARAHLADVLVAQAHASGLSSLHVLFGTPEEIETLAARGLMIRRSVQFHWSNPGYATFDDYLAHLEGPKRRKVRAERRKVREAGIELETLVGTDATPADWAFFTRCYERTYAAHFSTPYLNRRFFEHLGRTMGEQVLLVIARRGAKRIAATLSLFDEDTLYGRYWGETEHVPCLHFEACYYAPIAFCIERGIRRFEGGAQGEHKLARGFLPAAMQSAHWIAHPAFADAVERFLDREAQGIDGYLDELGEHAPFRDRFRDAESRAPGSAPDVAQALQLRETC